jgi:multidrug transporter EmrE-like cation transporter
MNNIILSWGMVITYVVLNSFGALIIKEKINRIGAADFSTFAGFCKYFLTVFTSPIIIFSFVLIFVSAVAWIAALSRMDITIAYPVATSLNFLIVIFVAILILGEPLTLIKGIGITLMLISIFLMTKA